MDKVYHPVAVIESLRGSVVLRESGASSAPQPCESIIAVGDYWIIRFRG
jgi:hypothetical protein